MRAGDEVLAPGIFASPALGLFHLSTAADLGHVPSILALACLHQHIRPRKGVLCSLPESLQQPLATDHEAATRYTLLAAEMGVTSASAWLGLDHCRPLGVVSPPAALCPLALAL